MSDLREYFRTHLNDPIIKCKIEKLSKKLLEGKPLDSKDIYRLLDEDCKATEGGSE